MLHYKDRTNRIYVLTMDPALAADVDERVRFDPRMIGVEVIIPGDRGEVIAESDIAAVAKETITARMIVFDVRSQTLPRLQEPFNRVVGFNRADLNENCYSVCIGDGPPRLFEPGTSINLFVSLLAQCRIDYSAAAFFYDPLLHYTPDERTLAGVDHNNSLPRALPKRLAKAFPDDSLDVPDLRSYFRGASAELDRKEDVKHRRLAKLTKLYRQRVKKAFRDRSGGLSDLLSYEGHAIDDEILRLHTYPCFFEDWIFDLLRRIESR